MAFNDTPSKLESVWVQRNTGNQYYEQINISGSNLIVYHSSSGEVQADKIDVFFQKYGASAGGSLVKVDSGDTTADYLISKIAAGSNITFTIVNPGGNEYIRIDANSGTIVDQASIATQSLSASYVYFNGNRSITRGPYQGINLGTTQVTTFLDAFFFPFVGASISINSGVTYYETGSSQNISINGSITANSETVFGSGSVRWGGNDWYTFSSASSYSTTETGVSSSRVYQALMQVGNNGSPTLIQSSAKSISFIYPYLYGMSNTAGLSGTALYSALTRNVVTEQSLAVSCIGVATYIYFAFPITYGDLTSIKDPSGFEVSASFERSASVSVSSTGLAHDWTTLYKVYRLKLQADPNGTYTFYN